jgi:hypothetical protein
MEEAGGGKEDKVSIRARWTDANKAALVDALEYAPIEMGNTAYGRFEAKKK